MSNRGLLPAIRSAQNLPPQVGPAKGIAFRIESLLLARQRWNDSPKELGMQQAIQNIRYPLPIDRSIESFQTLVREGSVRIERIVSFGQCSPEGFWYDQSEQEWVVVIEGEARLQFDGDPEVVTLKVGDHLLIPAHKRHRVEWTCSAGPTIWIAVFFAA